MKIKHCLTIVIVVTLLTACQPAEPLPVFTSAYGLATPIPLPADSPKVAATLPGRIRSFSVSPDMKTIAIATSQGVVLYDLETYKHLQTLNKTDSVYLVDWSPDGKKLAAGGLIPSDAEFWKSHLVVWDTSAWKIVFEQTGDYDSLNSIFGDIAWSPNSRSLASSVDGMSVLVYNIKSGEVISRQETLSPYSISWSPDGSRLVATGDYASSIRRWKVSTDESVRLFSQSVGSFLQIAWPPDGRRIASGNYEGKVCFWTAATNKCDSLIRAHQSAVFSLVWSADGNQLATGGGVIRIWDTNTGKLVRSFGLNDSSIYTHLEWLGANQPLVSVEAGYENAALTIIRFWDVDTGKILFEFHGTIGSWGE
jgi:WD40 repeat protein